MVLLQSFVRLPVNRERLQQTSPTGGGLQSCSHSRASTRDKPPKRTRQSRLSSRLRLMPTAYAAVPALLTFRIQGMSEAQPSSSFNWMPTTVSLRHMTSPDGTLSPSIRMET